MINLIPFAYAAQAAPDGGSSTTGPGVVNIEEVATKGNFFAFTCIANLISNIISVALIVAAVSFFAFLVMGGIEWLSSGGDKAKIESAQKRITSALIGLVIVATSWAVYILVLNFFGINLSQICTTDPLGTGTTTP